METMPVTRLSTVFLLFLVLLAASPVPATAQELKFDERTATKESQTATTAIIKILIGGVLVIVLIAAVIYGVAKGMSRGDWGFFAACILSVIVAVLAVKGIASFFGIDLADLMKK
jgi:TRAP-type mannitol/chloroaromatic compound transport system permease large subunit